MSGCSCKARVVICLDVHRSPCGRVGYTMAWYEMSWAGDERMSTESWCDLNGLVRDVLYRNRPVFQQDACITLLYDAAQWRGAKLAYLKRIAKEAHVSSLSSCAWDAGGDYVLSLLRGAGHTHACYVNDSCAHSFQFTSLVDKTLREALRSMRAAGGNRTAAFARMRAPWRAIVMAAEKSRELLMQNLVHH